MLFDLFQRLARGDTAREIGDIRAIVTVARLDNYEKSLHNTSFLNKRTVVLFFVF
jgi:hypothetical protein